MAKVAKKTPAKTNIELNRWCIEMAMRWPVVHVPASYGPASYGNAVQGGIGGGGYAPPMPARDIDADVIGRAKRIMEWIKASH